MKRTIFSLVWFAVGTALASYGLVLLSHLAPQHFSLLVALGMMVGLFKGRFVIAKIGRRAAARHAKGGPLYSRREVITIAVMMGLGMSLRAFGVSPLVRGPILVAVGTALFVGAIATLRAVTYDRETP